MPKAKHNVIDWIDIMRLIFSRGQYRVTVELSSNFNSDDPASEFLIIDQIWEIRGYKNGECELIQWHATYGSYDNPPDASEVSLGLFSDPYECAKKILTEDFQDRLSNHLETVSYELHNQRVKTGEIEEIDIPF